MKIGHARRNRFLAWIFLLGAGAMIALTLAPLSIAATYQEHVLYSFCSAGGEYCTDGDDPTAGLIRDASGNFYGTTSAGGAYGGTYNGGTVFKLTANAAKTAWTHKVLYSFCAQGGYPACTDGNVPYAGLIMDASGNLYGTTSLGGAYGGGNIRTGGTVFELIPNAAKTAWTHKVLYSFCCADGSGPNAGLIRDSSGNFYGTTSAGGAFGFGTVFELTANAAKTAWTEKVLYSFCAQGGYPACTDGSTPSGGLIMDAAGKLYGTTVGGGSGMRDLGLPDQGGGKVFELIPNAAKTAWTYKVLYSFCARGGEFCTDGAGPYAGLTRDASGNLYGTTAQGGAHFGGTVFELIPNAAKTAWAYKILYSFCAQGGNNCTDGSWLYAGLIGDASGNLYGVTENGALNNSGTVFELTPNTAKTAWTHKVLYSFCSIGGDDCTDGASPFTASLIMDAAGNLYGTTFAGGTYNYGTVFELKP